MSQRVKPVVAEDMDQRRGTHPRAGIEVRTETECWIIHGTRRSSQAHPGRWRSTTSTEAKERKTKRKHWDSAREAVVAVQSLSLVRSRTAAVRDCCSRAGYRRTGAASSLRRCLRNPWRLSAFFCWQPSGGRRPAACGLRAPPRRAASILQDPPSVSCCHRGRICISFRAASRPSRVPTPANTSPPPQNESPCVVRRQPLATSSLRFLFVFAFSRVPIRTRDGIGTIS